MDSVPTAQTENEILKFWDLEFSEATTVAHINHFSRGSHIQKYKEKLQTRG